MKKQIFLIQLLFFIFLISTSDSNAQKIEIKNDIKYIKNSKPVWSEDIKVKLKFVQIIGKPESEDDNYLLFFPNDILQDENRNIYILDSGNNRIQKYDSNGEYIKTTGREGQGPVEFRSAHYFVFGSDSTIYVGDEGNKRIQILSLDGKYIESFRFMECTDFIVLNENEMLYYHARRRSEDFFKPTLMGIINRDGRLRNKFCTPEKYKDYDPDMVKLLSVSGNRVFMDIDSENYIYLVFERQNRIEKYNMAGKQIFRSERPLEYKISHKIRKVKNKRTGFEFDLPKFTMVSQGFGLDNKENMWIWTYKKQYTKGSRSKDIYILEIFNNDGILSGVIPFPVEWESYSADSRIRIFNDSIFFVNPASNLVYEYQIIYN